MAVTLIPETGANVADSNTYVSLADAETYFETRLNASVWDAAITDFKNRALVMATRIIDSRVRFKGTRVAPTTQSLEWPREDIEVDGDEWPSTSIPRDLKDSVAEFALYLLTSDRTTDPASSGIDEIGVGDGAVELKFNNRSEAAIVPETVTDLLEKWSESTGGSSGMVPTRRG